MEFDRVSSPGRETSSVSGGGGGGSHSPPSRTRLVIAAQALDLQHLQDVVRTKERELSEATRQQQETVDAETEKNRILTAKNARLESQVQLLAMKLHELEEAKETQMGTEVDNMMTMAQSGKERDALIGQLRDELKGLRGQNNALNQEREVILEKLVLERKKVAVLETKASSNSQNNKGGLMSAREASLVHRSCQTSDMTLSESLLDDASVVSIETLRRHIELEQQELNYHQEYAARHAANTNELHSRMQERLQYEVSRLNQEQEKYQSLLTNYTKVNVSSAAGASGVPNRAMSPTSSHGVVHQQQMAGATSGRSSTPTGPPGGVSPVPMTLDTSIDGIGGGRGPPTTMLAYQQPASAATSHYHHHSQQKAKVPFFQQQEREMQGIRERLLELQEAHNSGFPAGPPTPPSSSSTVSNNNHIGSHSYYHNNNRQQQPNRNSNVNGSHLMTPTSSRIQGDQGDDRSYLQHENPQQQQQQQQQQQYRTPPSSVSGSRYMDSGAADFGRGSASGGLVHRTGSASTVASSQANSAVSGGGGGSSSVLQRMLSKATQ